MPSKKYDASYLNHPGAKDLKAMCKILADEEDSPSRLQPAQSQATQPGIEQDMRPRPISVYDHYQGSQKLKNKVMLITGGDSGIGRAVAYHAALEGADIAFTYLDETQDAEETLEELKRLGAKCLAISSDLTQPTQSENIVKKVLAHFSKIDCLVNNAAVQYPQEDFKNISVEQLKKTFETNIFSYFYLTQAVLPHLKKGSTIINSSSVTAYRGSAHLIDYSATKGAIVSFTRSLAKSLVNAGIRVNAVAPGPVWTPLIPASFSAEEVEEFGSRIPLKEPAQPADIAPSYIFLASEESTYFTGQVLHPNGGEIFNT